MGLSTATVTPANFDIGPCRVTYNSQDIGGTMSGVKVTFKYDKAGLMADQYGKTLLDEAISGMECTITTEFAEVRAKQILKYVFPNVTYRGSSPADILEWDDKIATRQLPISQLLTLHPLIEGPSDVNHDWTFFKAMPDESSAIDFDPSKQRSLKINWKVYLDLTVSPARLFRYGDTTI